MLRSLQHVALTVPNLEVGRRFYTQMGLQARSCGDGLAFQCVGRPQDQVRLTEGPRKRLHYVSFGTTAAELPQLQQRLEAHGTRLLDAPVKEGGEGLWFHDDDGDLVNVRVAADAGQSRPPVQINNAGDFRRMSRRGAPDRNVDVNPRRLGHVLKFSTDIQRTFDYYTQVLGMKLSDRIGDLAGFLRFGGDSDHHVLAVAKSEGHGLHHMSFEMGNIDQIQFCAQRMLDAGYKDGWGFGRHIYGSNYFHYVRDPWGGLVEYFWDIDFVKGDDRWEAENAVASHESLYQWATTPPPEDFLRNFELQ